MSTDPKTLAMQGKRDLRIRLDEETYTKIRHAADEAGFRELSKFVLAVCEKIAEETTL